MPIINGVKYACEPCMRGHRSSKCMHEDRLLVRVRKPGRPLSSCPHLPPGPGGTPTFVNADGMRLDESSSTYGNVTGKPCGCEVTSLAIPKISSCACSFSKRVPPRPTSTLPPAPTQTSLNLNTQLPDPVPSPPLSPISPAPFYSTVTVDSGSNRISKNAKKRKSISLNGEAMLELVNRQSIENGINLSEVSDGGLYQNLHRSNLPISNGQTTNYAHNAGGTEPHEHIPIQLNGPANILDIQNSSLDKEGKEDMWGNINWQQETNILIPSNSQHVQMQVHDGVVSHLSQPMSLQQPKSCCNSCGSRSNTIAPFQLAMPFHFTQTPPRWYANNIQQMQPIATTIYTYPNGYTTINNPLTPQELAMLQAVGPWMSPAAAAAWSGLGFNGAANTEEHACFCGPTCECLGCAVHPFNSSTVNFVRDMRNMMCTGGTANIKAPRVSQNQIGAINGSTTKVNGCCGGRGPQGSSVNLSTSDSFNNQDQASILDFTALPNQQGFQQSLSPQSLQPVQNLGSPHIHSTPASGSPMPQHNPPPVANHTLSPPVRPHHCQTFFPPNISSPAYTSTSSPDPANNEDDTETEQHTVSPSAYFHIDYPFGLCSESECGCLCGDDCKCIGCIIHSNTTDTRPNLGLTFTGIAGTEEVPQQKNVNAERRTSWEDTVKVTSLNKQKTRGQT
ncbi:hypothetical protein BDZ91DRAFT_11494 [Kalaharituber pfeilii]|nr:hypothetical protein BDZ91DRAFT_11494 [Kalaharituber pfeilii]